MIEEIKIDGLLKEEIAEIDKKLELVLENETGCNTEDSKVFKDET